MKSARVTALLLMSLSAAACLAEQPPRTVRLTASEAAVRELWDALPETPAPEGPRGLQRMWKLLYTTWLPSEWPPTPRTIWTRYAYGLDLSLDGSSDVTAPFARIERQAGAPADCLVVPMAQKLKVIGIHPVRPHGGWKYTLDDEKRVLSFALALTSEPPADLRATLGLISYYRSWRAGSAEIAAHIAPRHRAFFSWLMLQEKGVD